VTRSAALLLGVAVLVPCGAAAGPPIAFGPPTTVATGLPNGVAATGDFNRDGKLDLVIASPAGLVVLLGTGTGGFGPPTLIPIPLGDQVKSIVVGDFDRDGKLDLAVGNRSGGVGGVLLLLGNGTGGFGPATPLGGLPLFFDAGPSLVTGDFNRDGRLDLAMTCGGSNDQVCVYLATGPGTFGAPTTVADLGFGLQGYLAVGDFNRDGIPDLALGSVAEHFIAVLLGNGTGGFGPPTSFGAGLAVHTVTVADVDRDGIPDLVSNVSVFRGVGDGTFLPGIDSPTSLGPVLALGDIDGDGRLDVAAGRSGTVVVSSGDGAGHFTPAATVPVGGDPIAIVIADLNGDGRADLLTVNGNGTVSVALNVTPRATPADFDGDGKADIVVGAGFGGGPHVRVLSGADGHELLSLYAYDPGFTGGVRVATCDVTGDGVPDIVTAAGAGGGPHIRVFDGRTGLQIPGPVGSFFAYDPGLLNGAFVSCADVDGDGVPDIITGAGPGGGPHVRVFSGVDGHELIGLFAYAPSFTGGVFVAP